MLKPNNMCWLRICVFDFQRMVHLVVPQDAESYRGHLGTADPETELHGGPGAGDASREGSGVYWTDIEDRDRTEEGGDDRERRGGEDEWERDTRQDRERIEGGEEERGGRTDAQDSHILDRLEVNHPTPDLDALIGEWTLFSLLNRQKRSGPSVKLKSEAETEA